MGPPAGIGVAGTLECELLPVLIHHYSGRFARFVREELQSSVPHLQEKLGWRRREDR